MLPVRCFSCGKVLSGKEYKWEYLCNIMSKEKALDELGMKRGCCRQNMLTNIDVCTQKLDYEASNSKPPDDTSDHYIKVYRRNSPSCRVKRRVYAR